MSDKAIFTPDPGIILLPSDRFFVRTMPVVATSDMAGQVTLALESLAPFPPAQLYYGWLCSTDGTSLLAYAAYRKRFSGEEVADWNDAEAVLPGFAALLGDPPREPVIRLMTETRTLTAAAWDGTGALPVAVMARETAQPAEPAQREALLGEIRRRTGLPDAKLQEFNGPPMRSRPQADTAAGWELNGAGSRITTRLTGAEVDAADVRDKGLLRVRRAALRRNRIIWLALVASLGGLAALLVLELGLSAGGLWLRNLKNTAQQQAAIVEKIETAQSLSNRIEEMTQHRLRPFEMLDFINRGRPASIRFTRMTTAGLRSLEIEAQTANATDVAQYEAALRSLAELSQVETRDLRSRDGVTSFTLSLTFKSGVLPGEAGT